MSTRRRGGRRRCGIIALLAWLCLLLPASAAALKARLSADNVAASQPVTLTLSDTAPLPAELDLTPLAADFQVLGQRRAETVTTVNGRSRERHELILTLLPRRSGELRVPPLDLGGARTAALALTVAATTSANARLLPAPAQSAPPPAADTPPQRITVSAEVRPLHGVVGAERVVTVRVRSPDGPPQGHLPTPKADDARLLALGTTRSTDPDGEQVLEQRFSVFPERAGQLRITNLGFDAWQPAGGAPVRHRAEPIALEVRPRPAAAGAPWLPARALGLSEAGPTEVRLAPGQGLERLLTLRAEGLPAERLPAIPLEIPFQLRVRDDPPRLWNEQTPDGIVGYRAERVLISAEEAGSYVLPGPSIAWWDTQAQQMRTASLPDWTLTVAPFASADRRPAARWERDQRAAGAAGAAPDAATDGEPAASGSRDKPAQQTDGIGLPGVWAWMAGVAGLTLLVVLSALLARRRRRRSRAGAAPPAQSEVTPAKATAADLDLLIAAVADAYGRTAAVQARDALLAWAAAVWPKGPPGNLSQLALRLEPPLSDDLKLLDKAFYGPGDDAWARRPVAERLAALQPQVTGSERAAPA